MEIAPYLVFKGQCAEAFAFYQETLGGRIVARQTFGESPAKDQVPADWQDKLIHIRLAVGDQVLMGSDAFGPCYQAPQGTSVSLSVSAPETAERIFKGLSEGGTVTMPFQKTFWSPGFGMVVDRYGTPWIVNALPAAAAV